MNQPIVPPSGNIISLDNLIESQREKVLNIVGTSKHAELSRKKAKSEFRELLKLKVLVTPIMSVIKKHVEYTPRRNMLEDIVLDQLERRIFTLDDSKINIEYCRMMTMYITMYISAFPIYVWKPWFVTVGTDMNPQQYDIFFKFYSIFSQLLNDAAKIGRQFMAGMPNSVRKTMVETVRDISSFKQYINEMKAAVAPFDLLLTILEYKGLSCRELNGLYARDLFIELFVKCADYDAMIIECDKCKKRGAGTLKNWLICNKQDEQYLQPIICYALRYRRSVLYRPAYVNPVEFCEKLGIPVNNFQSSKNAEPLVAELVTSFKYKKHNIVAVSFVSMMCFPRSDLLMFNNIVAFEQLYPGSKIAIVCTLGVVMPDNFKTDLAIMDLNTFKEYTLKN